MVACTACKTPLKPENFFDTPGILTYRCVRSQLKLHQKTLSSCFRKIYTYIHLWNDILSIWAEFSKKPVGSPGTASPPPPPPAKQTYVYVCVYVHYSPKTKDPNPKMDANLVDLDLEGLD